MGWSLTSGWMKRGVPGGAQPKGAVSPTNLPLGDSALSSLWTGSALYFGSKDSFNAIVGSVCLLEHFAYQSNNAYYIASRENRNPPVKGYHLKMSLGYDRYIHDTANKHSRSFNAIQKHIC